MNIDLLRVLVDARDRAAQKGRIAFSNRLKAIERGDDTSDEDTVKLLRHWFQRFHDVEKDLDEEIEEAAAEFPIIQQAIQVKGCGLVNVGKVVALLRTVENQDTPSKCWRFCGYGMGEYYVNKETGKIELPVKGRQYKKYAQPKDGRTGEWIVVYPEQPPNTVRKFRPDVSLTGYGLPFNRRLKTACWLVGRSFRLSGSPYYKVVYEAALRRYEETHAEDWTNAHRKEAAMRKMVKVWILHLWEAWRELEGLPTRKAYVLEKLGHTQEYIRFDFGWPQLAVSR